MLIHWMNLKNQMPDCGVVSRQSNGQTSRDLVSANMPVKPILDDWFMIG